MNLNQVECGACWLLGLLHGWELSSYPQWLDREAFARHTKTAVEILDGGTFRGPLVIVQLMKYVRALQENLQAKLQAKALLQQSADPNSK